MKFFISYVAYTARYEMSFFILRFIGYDMMINWSIIFRRDLFGPAVSGQNFAIESYPFHLLWDRFICYEIVLKIENRAQGPAKVSGRLYVWKT